jgi:hypothetical protein
MSAAAELAACKTRLQATSLVHCLHCRTEIRFWGRISGIPSPDDLPLATVATMLRDCWSKGFGEL